MPQSPFLGLQQRTSQNQQQVQKQTLKLTQQQLLSLQLLSMPSPQLREEIYSYADKNPALIITRDSLPGSVNTGVKINRFSDNQRLSTATKAGVEASDAFQEALESSPDHPKTIRQHLRDQFLLENHSALETKLGLRIIENLDSHGFHIFSPYSLSDWDILFNADGTENSTASIKTLENLKKTPPAPLVDKLVNEIQLLEPTGCCCTDYKESLFVQAKADGNAPSMALFILNGNFDVLNPPRPEKILQKVHSLNQKDYSLSDAEEALAYIQTLNPFPAAGYSTVPESFIAPDVFVEQDPESGQLVVQVNNEILPVMDISKQFLALSEDRTRVTKSTEATEKKRAEHRFVMEKVRDAKAFMDSIQYRANTIEAAARQIVFHQQEFFLKGRQFLKPLLQKQLADEIKVHPSTVSKMASSKYLLCQWGLFPLSFFFSNAAASAVELQESDSSLKEPSAESKNQSLSQEAVKYQLQLILQEHASDKKPLSDQKLSDLLAQRGIKIARRTVAKYRSQLNIDSSYIR